MMEKGCIGFPICLDGVWDIVVVGAGPAGLSASRKTALGGLRTLVLDRRFQVGVPVQCAEYVPLRLAMEFPRAVWGQKVEEMWTFVEGKIVAKNHWPGVVLHRELADRFLAKRAEDAGAILLTRARVTGVEKGRVTFQSEGRVHTVRTRFVLGADGPLSICARSLGDKRGPFLHSLQVRVPLREEMHRSEVHFKVEFRGGYGWLFPKGEKANVGLAVARTEAPRLKEFLRAFLWELAQRGLIHGVGLRDLSGGLVPIGGPLSRTAQEWILLAGDAASQTDPITGGGIPNALLCGELAGEAVREALGRGDPREALNYEEMWRDLLGRGLERAARHRRRMEEDWGRKPLEEVVRAHWVAFREYFKG